ncbi:hypothetical protein N7537_008947 [Penicillium hordei]|uniref:Uncharacterized protein n=1 Tax=Penicillium hordei TaxID=40994 RepID=A0AAD6H250_9EURO|nr:uncharacterized protein N7537_008947 [Penicillium hordei]KAJ5598863.1 hypothetical protein N7537_008947 [Penicillium hordei]
MRLHQDDHLPRKVVAVVDRTANINNAAEALSMNTSRSPRVKYNETRDGKEKKNKRKQGDYGSYRPS